MNTVSCPPIQFGGSLWIPSGTDSTSLHILFLCLIILMKKKIFIVSSLNLLLSVLNYCTCPPTTRLGKKCLSSLKLPLCFEKPQLSLLRAFCSSGWMQLFSTIFKTTGSSRIQMEKGIQVKFKVYRFEITFNRANSVYGCTLNKTG